MSEIKPAPSPSLTDLASRINTEFAAIQKAEQDTNKSAPPRYWFGQNALSGEGKGRPRQVGEMAH
jgi:hypothetical protein